MPQIPVYVGGQRVEAGSPVPINSAENTGEGMMASAVEKFGASMFKFGDILDDVYRKNKDEADKYLTQKLQAQYAQGLMMLRYAQEQEKPRDDDGPTGANAFGRFREQAQKMRDKLGEGLSDRQRMIFETLAEKENEQIAPVVLAGEVKKFEIHKKILQQDWLSGLSETVENTPTEKTLKDNILIMENRIMSDSTIAEAQKPAQIWGHKKAFGDAMIRGYMRKNDYQGARKALKENLGNIYDNEEKDKKYREIDAAQQNYNQIDWQNHQRAKRLEEEYQAKQVAAASLYYQKAKNAAGNNQFVIDELDHAIVNDPVFANKPEVIKTMLMPSHISTVRDDKAEVDFWRMSIKKNSFLGMDTYLKDEFYGGRLTADRYAKLIKAVEGMRDAALKDPFLQRELTAAAAEIRARGTTKVIGPNGLIIGEDVKQEALRAETSFFSQVRKEAEKGRLSSATIKAIKTRLIKDELGDIVDLPRVPGIRPESLQTPDDIKKTKVQRNLIFMDIQRRVKAGTLSKKDAMAELEILQKQARGIKQYEENKGLQDRMRGQPIAVPVEAPAAPEVGNEL